MNFAEWLKRVDIAVQSLAMISLDDLPDYPYRDDYDSGMTPRETAKQILEEEGYFDDPYENPEVGRRYLDLEEDNPRRTRTCDLCDGEGVIESELGEPYMTCPECGGRGEIHLDLEEADEYE